MKTFWRYGLCLLAAALCISLSAQTISQPQLVGKWKLNAVKSEFHYAPRPKEATLTISQATASAFKWHLTGKETDGTRKVTRFNGAIDGKFYAVEGAPNGARFSYVDNNGVLETTGTYPGGTIHETLTLSPDGNTMTAQGSADNPPASWTEVWERVPDKRK